MAELVLVIGGERSDRTWPIKSQLKRLCSIGLLTSFPAFIASMVVTVVLSFITKPRSEEVLKAALTRSSLRPRSS